MKDDSDKAIEALEAAEDYFLALEAIERRRQHEPDNVELQYRAALNLLRVGRVQEAEVCFRACVDAGLDTPMVHLNLGHALKAQVRSGEAAREYWRLVDSEDDAYAGIGYWSLADLKDYHFDDGTLAGLEQRLTASDAKPGYRGLMLFALACAREQRSNDEAAWQAMREANDIVAMHRPFQSEHYGRLVHALMNDVKTPASAEDQGGVVPIFIVGMPRSGSTLVEQILAAHSSVEPTDELPFLGQAGLELEQTGGYARRLASMDAQQAETLAARYLSRVAPYRQAGRGFFIDKNPSNFLHVGLIKRLFPAARIVNVIRDPLDNAMSVYKQYFNRGNEYSYSLDAIIYYWQGYVTLMRHWERLYPDTILHLEYEALAREPRRKIGKLLDYCGLTAESACFDFYQSDQPVLTPSASQVRRPISTASLGSGLRYQPFIKLFVPRLAELKVKSREVFGLTRP